MKDESGGAIEDKKSKRHNKVCHKKSLSLRIMKTVQKQLNLKIKYPKKK